MVNLIAVDCEKVKVAVQFISFMWSGGAPLFPQYIQKSRSLFSSHYCSAWWSPTFLSSAPLQVGLSVYFIWDLLGPSVLVGKTTSVNCKRTVLVIVVFTKVLFCDLDKVLFTTGIASLRTGSSCDLSTTECFGTYYYLHPKHYPYKSRLAWLKRVSIKAW